MHARIYPSYVHSTAWLDVRVFARVYVRPWFRGLVRDACARAFRADACARAFRADLPGPARAASSGATALAGALRGDVTLRRLSIDGNRMGRRGVMALVQAAPSTACGPCHPCLAPRTISTRPARTSPTRVHPIRVAPHPPHRHLSVHPRRPRPQAILGLVDRARFIAMACARVSGDTRQGRRTDGHALVRAHGPQSSVSSLSRDSLLAAPPRPHPAGGGGQPALRGHGHGPCRRLTWAPPAAPGRAGSPRLIIGRGRGHCAGCCMMAAGGALS
jgi:hypothetical protein